MPEQDVEWLARVFLQTRSRDAADTLAGALLPRITHIVRGRVVVPDPAIAEDAAADAIMAFLRRPTIYDEQKSRLVSFLATVAIRRALDWVDKQNRERCRADAFRGQLMAAHIINPRSEVTEDEASGFQLDSLRRLAITDPERRYIDARIRGATRTRDLATALGLEAFPPDEQRRTLKRISERLRQRARRWRMNPVRDD